MSCGKENPKTDLIRLSLTLFAITAVVAVLLALANSITAPIIEASAQERLNQSLNALMPQATMFEEVEDYDNSVVLGSTKVNITAVYAAKSSDGVHMGYCVNTAPVGYSDVIDMIVAVDQEGAVCGVQILSIADTPGIGMKVQSDAEFQKSVYGLKDSATIVKNPPKNTTEIQVISGASVSSSAYINGVNAALETVQAIEQEAQK